MDLFAFWRRLRAPVAATPDERAEPALPMPVLRVPTPAPTPADAVSTIVDGVVDSARASIAPHLAAVRGRGLDDPRLVCMPARDLAARLADLLQAGLTDLRVYTLGEVTTAYHELLMADGIRPLPWNHVCVALREHLGIGKVYGDGPRKPDGRRHRVVIFKVPPRVVAPEIDVETDDLPLLRLVA